MYFGGATIIPKMASQFGRPTSAAWVRERRIDAHAGIDGTPRRTQTRSPVLQRAISRAHAVGADNRRAGWLFRNHALQPEQRFGRGVSGHIAPRAGSRSTAGRHDRIRSGPIVGTSHVRWNGSEFRGSVDRPKRVLPATRSSWSSTRSPRRTHRCAAGWYDRAARVTLAPTAA